MNRPEPPPKQATRIQRKNRKAILEAALQVFSAHGFRGSTIDRIAERAGLSKPNLLYYFPSKEAIYLAVLEDTLEEWLQPLRDLDPAGDPIEEIGRYIAAKLEMSRTRPRGLAPLRQRDPARRAGDRRFSGRAAEGRWSTRRPPSSPGWIADGRLAQDRSSPPDHDDLGSDAALRRFRRAG